jgi:hypothetical protein
VRLLALFGSRALPPLSVQWVNPGHDCSDAASPCGGQTWHTAAPGERCTCRDGDARTRAINH